MWERQKSVGVGGVFTLLPAKGQKERVNALSKRLRPRTLKLLTPQCKQSGANAEVRRLDPTKRTVTKAAVQARSAGAHFRARREMNALGKCSKV